MDASFDRTHWIDIFRGISILLVVMQHCFGTDTPGKFILSFHMSLFFWISGFCYANKKISYKKLKYLGMKFLKYQLLVGVLNVVKYYVFQELIYHKISEQRWLDYFFTWFLPTLFWVLVFYTLFGHFISNKRNCILLFLTSSVISYGLIFIDMGWDRIHLMKMPLALSFFLLGKIIGETKIINIISKYHYSKLFFFATVFFLFTIVIEKWNSPVYWYQYNFGNFFIFLLTSLSGIVFVLLISMAVKKQKLLEALGKNSIVIYSIQFLIIYLVKDQIYRFQLASWMKNYCSFGVAIFLCVLLVYCVNNISERLKIKGSC